MVPQTLVIVLKILSFLPGGFVLPKNIEVVFDPGYPVILRCSLIHQT